MVVDATSLYMAGTVLTIPLDDKSIASAHSQNNLTFPPTENLQKDVLTKSEADPPLPQTHSRIGYFVTYLLVILLDLGRPPPSPPPPLLARSRRIPAASPRHQGVGGEGRGLPRPPVTEAERVGLGAKQRGLVVPAVGVVGGREAALEAEAARLERGRRGGGRGAAVVLQYRLHSR